MKRKDINPLAKYSYNHKLPRDTTFDDIIFDVAEKMFGGIGMMLPFQLESPFPIDWESFVMPMVTNIEAMCIADDLPSIEPMVKYEGGIMKFEFTDGKERTSKIMRR